jgi:hypothetical protein
MRDAACALGQLGFDPQSLFVDHLGHVGHGRDFTLPPTNVAIPDHSYRPLFPTL